ncbi:MAG: transketolase, partial [Phascolarctobacterium sp.]|nr:transketolase [Phascolarctobacterium sp.]
MRTLDHVCINTLRFLSVDQVEKAKSGHPGFPLGTASLMYTVWDRFMRYNPEDPAWFNRDRFILSPGHGSALLYAMLHLAGYDLSLEELKNFRQWGSKTPGHPEYGHTPGVDVSTGPLGHGFAMGVGLAIAEVMMAARYNKDGYPVIDHYTYGLTSDGDLMEGVSSEAASLAGTLGLGKIIYLYDDNKITIEGDTDIAFSEDVESRFKSYDWQVLRVENSEDIDALANAMKEGQKDKEHPTLIMVRTHIGFGSPKQDSPLCHGEPLGTEALAAT